MNLISNLILQVLDGNTVASTEIYGTNKKTYINIGSGDVFKLQWNTPELAVDDSIEHYDLVIKRHDTILDVYYNIYNKSIGLVNEFVVESSLLPTLPTQYMLSIYLVAYSTQGSVIISNVENPYISKGSGSYVCVKVEDTEDAPLIMKRAIAFTKIALPRLVDKNIKLLKDSKGRTLTLTSLPDKYARVRDLADSDSELLKASGGVQLTAKAANVLNIVNGLTLVQNIYMQDSSGSWQQSDIKDEVLIVES